MRRAILLTASVSLVGAGAALAAAPSPFSSLTARPTLAQPATAQVMVHCPAGDREAFVTPQQVRVRVGESVEWRMNGQVASDSIAVSLKDSEQNWPFDGAPSRGGQAARANNARTPGTFGYNVRLLCRIPNEGVREVIIDPDIIIVP